MEMLFNFLNPLRRIERLCFREEDGGGGSGGEQNSADDGDNSNNSDDGKTFTQDQVNAIAAADRRRGQNEVYKELGFEDPEVAKKWIADQKAAEDAKKDELTKAQEAKNEMEAQKADEAAKREFLEQKFSVVEAGADPKFADGIVKLVQTEMSDSVTFEQALEKVKEDWPEKFGQSDSGSGTGGGGGNNPRQRGGTETKGIGSRIAEKKAAELKKVQDNPYFK